MFASARMVPLPSLLVRERLSARNKVTKIAQAADQDTVFPQKLEKGRKRALPMFVRVLEVLTLTLVEQVGPCAKSTAKKIARVAMQATRFLPQPMRICKIANPIHAQRLSFRRTNNTIHLDVTKAFSLANIVKLVARLVTLVMMLHGRAQLLVISLVTLPRAKLKNAITSQVRCSHRTPLHTIALT
jgi:hypothetical protein